MNARFLETHSEDDTQGPVYRASRYTVYPTGYSRVSAPQRRQWRIFVEDSGDGWAVRWRNRCLSYSSVWEFEPPPKGRTPEFLGRCRFTERSALLRARRVADLFTVDGMTYDEFVARVHAEAENAAKAFVESGQALPVGLGAEGSLGSAVWSKFLHAFHYKNRLD